MHLTLGVRAFHVRLLESRQGRPYEDSFIGSIYKLEANQDTSTFRPYAQVVVRIGPVFLGGGLSSAELDVTTVDEGGGDGDIRMDSRMQYFVAAWPNSTPLLPYIEIGKARYDNHFDPLPDWSQEGRREFQLEDSEATYVAGGCLVEVYQGLSIDLYVRRVDVDIDGIYIFRGDDRENEPFTFTLEHIAYGFGLAYTF